MAEDMTPKCAAGVDTRRRVIRLETDNEDQWNAINKLRDRLPVWATLLFSVISLLLGGALTYAALAGRLAQVGQLAAK